MLNWLSNIEICIEYRDDILEVETLGKRHESCAELKVDNNYFSSNGVSYVTSLFYSSLFLTMVFSKQRIVSSDCIT